MVSSSDPENPPDKDNRVLQPGYPWAVMICTPVQADASPGRPAGQQRRFTLNQRHEINPPPPAPGWQYKCVGRAVQPREEGLLEVLPQNVHRGQPIPEFRGGGQLPSHPVLGWSSSRTDRDSQIRKG